MVSASVQNREFQLFRPECESMYKQAGHGLHRPGNFYSVFESDFFTELWVCPGRGNEKSLIFRQLQKPQNVLRTVFSCRAFAWAFHIAGSKLSARLAVFRLTVSSTRCSLSCQPHIYWHFQLTCCFAEQGPHQGH